MKLMPALPESIFDIGYLAFAIISGVLMLKNEKGRRLATLFGAMTLVLGCGDAFHLIPRVLNYFTNLNMTAALGIGKLVTSVTMTVFYVLLEYARRERHGEAASGCNPTCSPTVPPCPVRRCPASREDRAGGSSASSPSPSVPGSGSRTNSGPESTSWT